MFLKNTVKNKIWWLVAGCMMISLALNILFHSGLCFNADEAAFGYNAYSILKTGRDEYGTLAPLRLKSFGDYKMPLYSYLSVPFIATMGLNEVSTRALNSLIAFLFPLVVFLLTKELFKNSKVALLASFLTAVCVGLQIVGRQAHEGYLTAFLITTATLFFLRQSKLFFVFLLLSLFGYQSSRLFALFFIGWSLINTIQKKTTKLFLVLLIVICAIGFFPDLVYKPARVSNLLFFNTPGFSLMVNELRGEGGSFLMYNKLTMGIKQVTINYLAYLSPEFLTIQGDENYRFGFPGYMSPITVVEYFGVLIGIFFMFAKKEKWRYFIFSMLLITPIPAALSWAGISLTRSLFMLIPILILSSYGFINFFESMPRKYRALSIILIGGAFAFFLFYNWNFYLFHYPQRALAIRGSQCGYRALSEYIEKAYPSHEAIYISKENGEPYIFQLFYLAFDPATYQKQAHLSAPDEYGFGQVESFDKFKFNFEASPKEKTYLLIGTPEDFKSHKDLDSKKKTSIKVGTEELFQIYDKST